MLSLAILGLALVIAGIAIAVAGITTGARFGSDPPPNAGQLGTGQMLGGVGIFLLGLLQTGSALAVLADVRSSRIVAALVAAGSAILGAVGTLLVASQPNGGAVLPAGLAVGTVILAAIAIVLGRPRRG